MLSNIPQRKIDREKEKVVSSCEVCSTTNTNIKGRCQRCSKLMLIISRYAEANIPIKYWPLDMEKDFVGDPTLLNKYKEIAKDLRGVYDNGMCICFAGGHGIGKTMTVTNILKRAVGKGFSGLYVTMNDIVANLVSSNSFDKAAIRRNLLMVDFLVIDEFDPRYMGTQAAADMFGRNMEDIFRTRTQNSLPIFMCTNSPNVTKSFDGSIGQSISSLMNYSEIVSVLGKDRRKEGK